MDAIGPTISSFLREKLYESVVEAMEPIGFMEVEYSEDEVPYNMGVERIRVDILVEAPFPGEIRLIIPRDLGMEVTGNLHSFDSKEVTTKQLSDLLAEVLNVIAGRFMSKIVSPAIPFKIGLPSLGQNVFLSTQASQATFHFEMEGKPFWVVLVGEGFFR